MDKFQMHTPDLAEEKFRRLAELFPNAVTETIDAQGNVVRAIDQDVLEQEISATVVKGPQERYQFTWPDKRKAMVLASAPAYQTLRLVRDRSVGRDGTPGQIDSKNIYIEGSNQDALKLIRETYFGKIKLMYIDPPYNTGGDLIYKDRFFQPTEDYLPDSGQFDEEGNWLVTNPESNGRFHTDWLNMIYPTMRLARDLLARDGALFISLDDKESANMVKICDEIFGRQNRVALICHKARASVSNDKIISPNHNTVLFYARDYNTLHLRRKQIGLDPDLSGFHLDDGDGKGPYRLVPVDGPGGAKKGNPYYEFLGVKGYFRFSRETMQEKFDQGLVVKKGGSLYQKYYLSAAKEARKTATTWWDDAGLTSNATSYLRGLMGGAYFDNPKPLELLEKMLQMMTAQDPEALVMDFFSGSATTAEAVMRMNQTDKGHRQFILVQIQEDVPEDSEAYQAGFRTICDIGEERIRRAGQKLREEGNPPPDCGFRVFRVDSTNMEDVYYQPKQYRQEQLLSFSDNIKPDRTPEDLLFQVMLEFGVPLSSPITETVIAGQRVFDLSDGYLLACFDAQVTEEVVTQIALRKPAYAAFRDSGMASDTVAENFEQIFATYSPKTVRKVL